MVHLYQNPIEMPRGSHYGSDYWIVYSYKLKRHVHLYSMLEYANFLTLEMNPQVEYFCEQPLRIEDSSQKKSSVFDFWVQYTDSSTEFQEVKYSAELTDNTETAGRSQRQIEFQRNWCSLHDHNYKVITEKELYVGPFTIQNLSLLQSHLLRYSKSECNEMNKILGLLEKSPLLIIDILNLSHSGQDLGIIASLLYSGKITINIDYRPLDNYTEVSLCEAKNTIY